MRIRIVAVGRLRAGPEAALVQDYLTRFDRTGRGLGLGPAVVTELDARKGGQSAEAELIQKAIAGASHVVALDERGTTAGSVRFARKLAGLRDDGNAQIDFVIGGADGLTDPVRHLSTELMSFGPMVWPHMLVRAMLAEQLYRAASILAGSPYHRS